MQIEIAAASAMIVPGSARSEIAPTNSRPNGVRPSEPNQSRLTTRESMCRGTSSISIVSQTVTPKPMQIPRTNAAAAASGNQGERAKTITSRLFTIQIRYEIRPRRRLGFTWPKMNVPTIMPPPISEKSSP